MKNSDLILKEKPSRALEHLYKIRKDTYAGELKSEIDTTYSHMIKIVKRLEENGLIIKKREGRLRPINLTDKGEEVAKKVVELREVVE